MLAMGRVKWMRILLLLLLSVSLPGQESDEWLDSLLGKRLFDELFDTTLPGLYKEGDWGLRFRPKMGDFLDDDYVRMLGGLRYSFSNYFDAYVDLGAYVPNPIQSGSGSGVYAWRFGARYSWYNVGRWKNDIAVGVNEEIPISDPPEEITDGYARHEPYITISHQFDNYPNWRIYLNAAYEFVSDSAIKSDPVSPQPDDRLFLRPGVIFYDGGKFRYSMELEYRTNVLHFTNDRVTPMDYMGPPDDVRRPQNWILAYEDVHEIIAYPGLTWFPTREVRDGFIIPGNWDIGVRIKLPIIEETGQDIGISVRLRWHYDYGKQIRKEFNRLLGRR